MSLIEVSESFFLIELHSAAFGLDESSPTIGERLLALRYFVKRSLLTTMNIN